MYLIRQMQPATLGMEGALPFGNHIPLASSEVILLRKNGSDNAINDNPEKRKTAELGLILLEVFILPSFVLV